MVRTALLDRVHGDHPDPKIPVRSPSASVAARVSKNACPPHSTVSKAAESPKNVCTSAPVSAHTIPTGLTSTVNDTVPSIPPFPGHHASLIIDK